VSWKINRWSPALRYVRYTIVQAAIPEVQTMETYYEALYESSQGWHEGEHDLMPWWSYWTGTVLAAYREFADRVGTFTTARGAKGELVAQAIERLPTRFRITQIEELCPGVSRETVRKVLNRLKADGKIKCVRRGPDAEWAKKD
jgi:hypothetical protein